MYLEHLKKIKVKKDLLERSLIASGKYPNKRYIDNLLKDIDTKLSIFNYDNVHANEYLDIEKLNSDLYCILQDLIIIYEIIDELAKDKYIELEAFINGYLKSLEQTVERAEKKAAFETATTTLNSNMVFFQDSPPSIQFIDQKAEIKLGSLSFEALSKVFCNIAGTGFDYEKVVFVIGDKRVSPYTVNKEYFKNGGKVTKTTFNYAVDKDEVKTGAFKLANQGITASESNYYKIYGGQNCFFTCSDVVEIQPREQVENNILKTATDISFYVVNGTKINFEFTNTPTKKNFDGYSINLDKNKVQQIRFTMPYGSFTVNTDGDIYATKETPFVRGEDLYIANTTKAQDFYIEQYAPGDKTTYDVSIIIYDVDPDNIHIDSIAIQEVSDLEVDNE